MDPHAAALVPGREAARISAPARWRRGVIGRRGRELEVLGHRDLLGTDILRLFDPFGFLFQAFFRFCQQALGRALFGDKAFQPGEGVISFCFALAQLFKAGSGLGFHGSTFLWDFRG